MHILEAETFNCSLSAQNWRLVYRAEFFLLSNELWTTQKKSAVFLVCSCSVWCVATQETVLITDTVSSEMFVCTIVRCWQGLSAQKIPSVVFCSVSKWPNAPIYSSSGNPAQLKLGKHTRPFYIIFSISAQPRPARWHNTVTMLLSWLSCYVRDIFIFAGGKSASNLRFPAISYYFFLFNDDLKCTIQHTIFSKPDWSHFIMLY